MTDENVKTASVITCTGCGCLVSTSYWATHVGVCTAVQRAEPATQRSKDEQAAKDYWR